MEDRPALAVVDVDLDAIAKRLAEPGFAVVFLGRAGRGKTTHLRALHARFSDLPYTYLPEDGQLPGIPRADVVFIDEVQRLAPARRERLFRRKASFALASHAVHTTELRGAGLDVEVFRVGGLTPERLQRYVERRIEWARRAPGPLPEVPRPLLVRLRAHYGDDLRAIEDALYDWVQRGMPGAVRPTTSEVATVPTRAGRPRGSEGT